MAEPSSSNSSSPALTASTPPSSVPSPQMQNLTLADLPKVSDEDKAEAARIKTEANKAFTSHDFPTAAKLYSEAIDKNPNEPTLWCNRTYARMKLEEFGYALSDATQAIQLDPRYVKAYYRRATCYLQTLKPQLAVADFKKILAIEPGNETVRQQMVSTQKLIRKIEFEKAIELEEEKDAVTRCLEIIAEGGCDLDKIYTGPKLPYEDGKYGITLQFVREMIKWFKDGKTLPKRYVWEIALGAHGAFASEESLVEVSIKDGATVDVIGDVHGKFDRQFYDVLHLFSLTGEPNENHYLLMNGDLVDRGSWSVEVILTAFAFKWLYPKCMFINRGNHEAKEMNRTYGFEGEAKTKHGEQSYKLFAHIFTTLPLATLVIATKAPTAKEAAGAILSSDGFKRYFVVHGGLFSKDEVMLDDIRQIPRVGKQPGTEGLMCACLLWTDPQEAPGRGPSKRGVGIAFGPDITKRWCMLNKVSGIIRSHEVRQNGYQIEHDGLCTTVFSAPNYVDQAGNKGAFVRADIDCS
ncbi:Serine/threonine-protein phosphatase T [Leucoagaricus sp. SymC.cos]|nr:Serine/threonine-protein phosphatase T [Leucoagaricus sp. SymC.cos]